MMTGSIVESFLRQASCRLFIFVPKPVAQPILAVLPLRLFANQQRRAARTMQRRAEPGGSIRTPPAYPEMPPEPQAKEPRNRGMPTIGYVYLQAL
jgi:hypothetical protein